MRFPVPKANTPNCPKDHQLSSTRSHLRYSSLTELMHYKASTITPKIPEKMTSTAPVAIGTRGTVGSLVRKEIEYFTKFELDPFGSSRKIQEQVVEVGSNGGRSKPAGFWSLKMSWRRKKRSPNCGFLPNICSVVEVADTNQLNGIPGFSYITLKDDMKNMHI